MPRKPYRSPRDWLEVDRTRSFGMNSADGLKWLAPQSALEEALLAAAQRQNNLSYRIRLHVRQGKGTAELAAFADLHPDTVRDVLNGSKHATLAVLHALALGMGLKLNLSSTPVTDADSSEGHTA